MVIFSIMLGIWCFGADRYKDYVKHLVTRINTINGRKYSEDSTIFGAFPAAPFVGSACSVSVGLSASHASRAGMHMQHNTKEPSSKWILSLPTMHPGLLHTTRLSPW